MLLAELKLIHFIKTILKCIALLKEFQSILEHVQVEIKHVEDVR